MSALDDDGDTITSASSCRQRPPSKASEPPRKLSDLQKLALTALTEAVLARGKPAPAVFELPHGITVVEADAWRDEMFRTGVLDKDNPNPRSDFRRIRQLAARHLIGERDGLVWSAVA